MIFKVSVSKKRFFELISYYKGNFILEDFSEFNINRKPKLNILFHIVFNNEDKKDHNGIRG